MDMSMRCIHHVHAKLWVQAHQNIEFWAFGSILSVSVGFWSYVQEISRRSQIWPQIRPWNHQNDTNELDLGTTKMIPWTLKVPLNKGQTLESLKHFKHFQGLWGLLWDL